jgi:disulfide bond formation protein DsbB
MTTDTVILFLALLALLAQVLVVGALVLAVGSRWSDPLAAAWARVRAEVGPQATGLAAAVAAVATAGSLYLSEVANFLPCRLCMLQRFAMYPLVVLLGVAAVTGWDHIRPAAAALAGVGALTSVYHLLIENFPSLESTTSCAVDNPCSIIWVERFGYLTIPGMALSGFLLILTLLAMAGPVDRPTTAQEAP